jgi:hypothetical protein
MQFGSAHRALPIFFDSIEEVPAQAMPLDF